MNQEARDYILEHDKRVKQLSRLAVIDLRIQLRELMTVRGQTLVYGGPVSKDEFISAILELEFPEISAQRAAYYASLQP